jgi:hypothetical protein
MKLLGDVDPANATGGSDTLPDRRRPGRHKHVSPELIPLLRHAATLEIPQEAFESSHPEDADRESVELDGDDLRPARGLAVGFVLAIPLWGLVVLSYWSVFG